MVSPKTDIASNPLINPPALPHGAPAFDKIKPEHFVPAMKWAIRKAKHRVREIKINTATPTFENTVEAYEYADFEMSRISSVLTFLNDFNSSPELRKARAAVDRMQDNYMGAIADDNVIFKRVMYVKRHAKNLEPDQKKLLQVIYKSFRDSGAHLSKRKQERIFEIENELEELTSKYAQNISRDTKKYQKVITDEAILDGIPERAKKDMREAAEQAGYKGKWLIRLLPYPNDILAYARNRDLRREILLALYNLAAEGATDNRPLIARIVNLRHQYAKIMGATSFASYVMRSSMARRLSTVRSFLAENLRTYRPAAQAHLDRVKKYAQAHDGLSEIERWDFSYYHHKLKQEVCRFDEEDVRAYFPYDRVCKGLLQHAEKLFDIRINDVSDKYPVYHPDVKVHEVSDKESGKVIGLIYMDYFARPGGKPSGAWTSCLYDHAIYQGKEYIPVVVNLGSLARPINGQPSLLSIDDVEVMFHEMGHAMHSVLARGRYPELSGCNVAGDFVELPSQLQENWLYQGEVLKTFARHYKTGKVIPKDLIHKICTSKNFGVGYFNLRQTFQNLLDMELHQSSIRSWSSIHKIESRLTKLTDVFNRPAIGSVLTDFDHLFSSSDGYAGCYYSYKWADVPDADIFARFKKNGLYNPELRKRLRDTIYAQGQHKSPSELFRDMMGRKPDSRALFRREGMPMPALAS